MNVYRPVTTLGMQPAPTVGDIGPDHSDPARSARVEAVIPFFKSNYIEHGPQTSIVEQLLVYLRSMQPLLGGPIDGRRLSEDSNAGKSRMIELLVRTAAERRAEAGLPPNPHQIIVLELDQTTSVHAFYRRILLEMGDPHWDDRRARLDDLEERIIHMSRRLCVEGVVADEVQHLDRKTTDARQVTNRLKTFLNRGILPLILVGDDDSKGFFENNSKFASRLGRPLKLQPLDVRNSAADRSRFLAFLEALDSSMTGACIIDEPAGLGLPGMRTQLSQVSGGHVGRVCRLVCEATQLALWRGSPRIELYDLSVATRDFAMPLGWIARDPFSLQDARPARRGSESAKK